MVSRLQFRTNGDQKLLQLEVDVFIHGIMVHTLEMVAFKCYCSESHLDYNNKYNPQDYEETSMYAVVFDFQIQ